MVAPIIELSGRVISGRPLRGSSRAAVATVKIVWGRESLFDRPRPGVAVVKIVNHGLNPDPPRKGEPLSIRHPDGGVLFRGYINDPETSAVKYVRLANGLREQITVTTVTAHDALAAFAQFIPTGPSTGPEPGLTPGWNYEGYGGWRVGSSASRIEQIRDAGAGRFVDTWGIPGAVVVSDPRTLSYCVPRKPSDTSALDHLHEAYSARRPLSTFSYDASQHRVEACHHADAAVAVVTLQGGAAGSLKIVPEATVPVLPASRVRLEDTMLRAPGEDVAEVRLEWMQPKSNYTNGQGWLVEWMEGANAQPVAGATSGSTYTSPHRQYVPELSSGANQEYHRYLLWWVGLAAERFAALNGIRTLPPLIIDPEDPALAALPTRWRTSSVVASVAYLAGSMFSGEGAPSVVQFIGGSLTYDEKGQWRHKLTGAPTAAGAPKGLSLDQMFPASSTDTLAGWDDALTINDLAAATRRA